MLQYTITRNVVRVCVHQFMNKVQSVRHYINLERYVCMSRVNVIMQWQT